MSKKLLYLGGILLAIIVGTVLFWNYCCDCGAKNRIMDHSAANNSIASIPDGKKTNLNTSSPDSDSLENWKAIREKMNANPMILYFEFNKSEVHLNQDQIKKLEEISDYLKNNPNGGLSATGHADNIGGHNINIKVGQARADFIKDYLVRNGANEAKIISSSKGPDDPVADNSTSEGRSKNRRAVILIK